MLDAALFILVFLAIVYGGVIVHELGHVVAALLAGWRPYSIQFGSGARWKLGSPASFEVRVGLSPFSGLVRVIPRSPAWLRTRLFITTLGGPLASVAYIASLYCVLPSCRSEAVQWAIGYGNLFEIVLLGCNLWPSIVQTSTGPILSDGLLLWEALRMPRAEVGRVYVATLSLYAQLLLEQGLEEAACTVMEQRLQLLGLPPPDPQVLFVRWLIHAGLLERAARRLDEIETGLSAEMLDQIACEILHLGHESAFPRAQALIARALALAPDSTTLRATQAHLLIEMGEIETGLNLIQEVLAKTARGHHDHAFCAYYRALAWHRLGRSREALDELARAEILAPELPPAKRIAGLIRAK